MKKILIIISPIIVLLFFTCSNLDEYDQESFDISEIDQIACESLIDTLIIQIDSLIVDTLGAIDTLIIDTTITDTLLNDVYTAGFERWVVVYDFDYQVSATLTDWFERTIVGFDTTYFFEFQSTEIFFDTISFALPGGVDTSIYYDTTFTVSDTIQSDIPIGIYSSTFPLHAEYPLKFIILNYGDGNEDTLRSRDEEFIFDYDDIYNSLNTLNLIFSQNDTAYKIINHFDFIDTYLLFDNNVSGEVIFYFDDFIDLNLMSKSGTTVDTLKSDETMSLELISSCTAGDLKPAVKSRFAFQLENQVYVFQLSTTEQTKGSSYNAYIFDGN